MLYLSSCSKQMLTVEINNFRQYESKTFTFNESKLTLITGLSGIGKSTIFEAIRWCMTGKVQKIAPHQNPKAKTSVKVIFPDGKTYHRLNSPKRFELITPEGHVLAEPDIDEKFWYATCYLKQLDFHPLLESTEAEKLNLITQIALRNGDPTTKIDKVKECINDLTSMLSKEQAVLLSMNNQLNKELRTNGLTIEDLDHIPAIRVKGVEISDPDELGLKIQECEIRKEQLHANKITYDLKLERYDTLKRQIMHSRDELSIKIIHLENEINIHYSQKDANQIIKERNDLMNAIDRLSKKYQPVKVSLPEREWTSAEIQKSMKLQHEYDINQSKAIKYKVDYELDAIQNEIRDLNSQIVKYSTLLDREREMIAARDRYRTYSDLKKNRDNSEKLLVQLNQKKDSLNPIQFDPKELAEVNSLIDSVNHHRESEYNDAQRELRQKVLKCPHCEQAIKLQQQTLIKISNYDPTKANMILSEISSEREHMLDELILRKNELVSIEKQYNTYVNSLQEIERGIIKVTATLDNINKTLKSYEDIASYDETPTDQEIVRNKPNYGLKIKELTQRISLLECIDVVSPPEVSHTLMSKQNEALKMIEIQKEIQVLEERLNELPSPEIQQLTYPDVNSTQKAIQKLRDELKLIDELESIQLGDDPTKSYEMISKAINQMRSSHSHMKLVGRLMTYQDSIIEQQHAIDEMTHRLEVLGNLRSKMEEAKYAALIVVVNQLNTRVNECLKHFFLDPITFRLDMFRENKSGKKDIKPKVNVNLMYKGYEVDLKSLSGGEYARLSLALLLSLAELNSTNLVMLDESLGTLESEDIERVVKFLKKYNREHHKTILCIGHTDITGWYDSLLSL